MSVGSISLLDRLLLRIAAWLALAAGFWYSVGGHHEEAEVAYRTALVNHPASETALELLGMSLEKQRRWKEAAEVYAEMVQRDPRNENAYYNRGNCLSEFGRYREARKDLERAIELYPKPHAAYVILGQVLIWGGHREDGLAALERAMELKPRNREVADLLLRARVGADIAKELNEL